MDKFDYIMDGMDRRRKALVYHDGASDGANMELVRYKGGYGYEHYEGEVRNHLNDIEVLIDRGLDSDEGKALTNSFFANY